MLQQNISNKYTLNEFTNTGIFKNYSPFCQEIVRYIHHHLITEQIYYDGIFTRNGSDNKITFSILKSNYEENKRNLLTFYPDSSKKPVKIEIWDQYNPPSPFQKEIKTKEDFNGEVIMRVKTLYNRLTNNL